jgi:hypothetical protein
MKASSLSVYGAPSVSSGSLSTPISASSYHGSFRVTETSGSRFSSDFVAGPSSRESVPYPSPSGEEDPYESGDMGREETDIRDEFQNFIQDIERLLAEPDERLSAPEIRESLERMVALYRSRHPAMLSSAASRMVSNYVIYNPLFSFDVFLLNQRIENLLCDCFPFQISLSTRRGSPGPFLPTAESRPSSRQETQRPSRNPGPRFHRSEASDFGSYMFPDSHGRSPRHHQNELPPDVGAGPSTRSGMTRLRNWLCKLLRNGSNPPSASAPWPGGNMGQTSTQSRNLALLASVAEVERRSVPREERGDEGEGMSRSQREHQRAGKRRHDTTDHRMDSDRREHPPKRK